VTISSPMVTHAVILTNVRIAIGRFGDPDLRQDDKVGRSG